MEIEAPAPIIPTPPAPAAAPARPGLRWRQILVWVVLPLLAMTLLGVDEALHMLSYHHDPRTAWMTLTGATGAGVVLVLMGYMGVRHARSQAEIRRHLAALEQLTAVSASINARIEQGDAVLDQLADAARRLLRMTRASVLVLEPGRETVRVAAALGDDRVRPGQVYDLVSAPVLRACIVQRRTVVIDDALRQEAHDLDLSRVRSYDVRAAIFSPLLAEGRVTGALIVADREPRPIGDAERRLAELWAAQAAVILQNRAMYQRMQEAMADQRRLEEQREAMTNLSLSIYTGDSLEVSLQAVADQAPALLGVDAITIAQILNPTTMQWQLTALTDEPQTRPMRGMQFVSGNSPATEALRRQVPVEIPDAEADPTLQQRMVQALRAKSLLFIPLNARDGTPIALMTLVLRRVAPFTAEQRRMAQYLVTRFGAAIEIARLRDRALADGQTKAILLRELHHRVKNNLAGIAGLLSINQPQLPPEAHQWLDRVGERIGAMAHAHELFSVEGNNLTLKQLFRAMLSSISAVGAGTVRIETTTDGADVALCPERAVALVMILHELCHNAMVHGLGEGGLLRIEATLLPLRQLLISVSDDGSAPVEPVPHLSSGMGLGLVQGLVKRELHGEFHMSPIPGGGTRARVQFRLLDCEPTDGAPTCSCVASQPAAT